MYLPFLHGKQFDLLAVKSLAGTLASSSVLPIIQPVRANFGALNRTVAELISHNDEVVVIANPKEGELSNNHNAIQTELQTRYGNNPYVLIGIILDATVSVPSVTAIQNAFPNNRIVYIHRRLGPGQNFAPLFNQNSIHAIVEGESSVAYGLGLSGSTRYLIQDNFPQRRNADHPDSEQFTDLNVNYSALGYDGFGDFTVMPAAYRGSGGQPYCVAVHVGFQQTPGPNLPVDIFHFKSNARTTAGQPAQKSQEALTEMVNGLAVQNPPIFEAGGLAALRALHTTGHYPGLGKMKEHQVRHHIELMRTVI